MYSCEYFKPLPRLLGTDGLTADDRVVVQRIRDLRDGGASPSTTGCWQTRSCRLINVHRSSRCGRSGSPESSPPSLTTSAWSEWDYLQDLDKRMAAGDEAIARALDEDAGGAEDAAGVTAAMRSEHDQSAEQRDTEEADAAVAAVVEQESAADAAANTEELLDLPWQPIAGIEDEMVEEHVVQATNREKADATFGAAIVGRANIRGRWPCNVDVRVPSLCR